MGTTLHLVCGKIASGKSTLISQLGRAPNTLVVSEDHWLARLYPGEQNTLAEYARNSWRLRDAMTAHLIDLLGRGLSVALDFPANTPDIDGSKFKAVNTRDKNFTRASIKRRMEQVEASIARYLSALDTADRHEGETAKAKSVRLKDKIASLREQMKAFKALEKEVHAAPDQQISLTDPDARAMATSGKGTGMVGYNVQTAVDTKHHLIVAHEVTNVGNDRGQLSNMAGQAKDAMGVEALEVLADRGYFSGEEILACGPLGVTPILPKPLTSGAKAEGRFGKQDFVYIPEDDTCRCPAGETLMWRFTSVEKGMTLHSYWTTKCATCPLKDQCTSSKQPRRIKRWEHEAVIDAMQERLDRKPDAMRIRRATAEHPFGTLKAWMGATHFKMRTLEKVKTEMSLHVLAYNLKRVIAILGSQPLMEAMRA